MGVPARGVRAIGEQDRIEIPGQAPPPTFQAARQTWSDGVHLSDSRGIATFRPERVGGSEECPVAAPILPFPVIALASGATSSNPRITRGFLAIWSQVWRLVTRSVIEGEGHVCLRQIAFAPTNRHVAAHVGNPVARGGGASPVVSLATGRTDKSSDPLVANRRSKPISARRPVAPRIKAGPRVTSARAAARTRGEWKAGLSARRPSRRTGRRRAELRKWRIGGATRAPRRDLLY